MRLPIPPPGQPQPIILLFPSILVKEDDLLPQSGCCIETAAGAAPMASSERATRFRCCSTDARQRRPNRRRPCPTGMLESARRDRAKKTPAIHAGARRAFGFLRTSLDTGIGAQEGTRTPTVSPPLGPEPSASTNSATWATAIDNFTFWTIPCQKNPLSPEKRAPRRRRLRSIR